MNVSPANRTADRDFFSLLSFECVFHRPVRSESEELTVRGYGINKAGSRDFLEALGESDCAIMVCVKAPENGRSTTCETAVSLQFQITYHYHDSRSAAETRGSIVDWRRIGELDGQKRKSSALEFVSGLNARL